MKKQLFTLLLLAFGATAAFSQIQPHAIGLRLGGGDGVGSEVSYQHALKANNRLELDLGLASGDNYNRMQITGLYQWVWNIQGALSWYAGAGAGIGQVNIKNGGNEFQLFLNGDVGIEYQFDVPIQISLDLRPGFGTSKYNNSSMAFAVRYTF